MITITQKGNFKKLDKYLERAKRFAKISILDKYGRKGIEVLSNATPVSSGKTAESWYYTIEHTSTGYSIIWSNSNVADEVSIAILLQYGHGTSNGGYVEGVDFINPRINKIFKEMAQEIWEEVQDL